MTKPGPATSIRSTLPPGPPSSPLQLGAEAGGHVARVFAQRRRQQHRRVGAVVAELRLGRPVEGGLGPARLAVAQGPRGPGHGGAQLCNRVAANLPRHGSSYGENGHQGTLSRLAGRRDHRHPLEPARAGGGPRRRRSAAASRRSGASATSSATAPSPTPAPTSSASAARSAWSATTISRCSARSTSPPSRRPRPRRSNGPGEHLRAARSSSCASSSRAGCATGIALFHASPRDPVWEYVLSLEQAHACMEVQPERVALIGHSHVSLFFSRSDGGRPRRHPRQPGRATARGSSSATAAAG